MPADSWNPSREPVQRGGTLVRRPGGPTSARPGRGFGIVGWRRIERRVQGAATCRWLGLVQGV